VVPLTTNLGGRRFGDSALLDGASAGLPRASLVKGMVETVERTKFVRSLGALSSRDMAAVEASLRDVLGL